MNPLCFVLMPFGRKPHEQGQIIDFDAVYRDMIGPAIAAAGLDAIRADEEQVGGTIHKPMFERLMLCEYAIADLTGANPNVYYELGIRHARRPRSTVLLLCQGTKMPFDIAQLRGMHYHVEADGRPLDAEKQAARIARLLKQLRSKPGDDSPVYQLIKDLPREDVDHAKTDIFREQAAYSRKVKARLETARKEGLAALNHLAAEDQLQQLHEVETGIIIDLFLSYRAVKGYAEMVALYERMPEALQRTTMVQEQYAAALNSLGRSDEAETILKRLIAERGASSETNGLLGRVYKDRYDRAETAGDTFAALGELKRAVGAYATGFEADWRDPYPGINALTLMRMLPKLDPRFDDMLPVVRYAALKRAQRETADYWDHATMIELAVLAEDPEQAFEWLTSAVPLVREEWEPERTASNLAKLRKRYERENRPADWIAEIESHLRKKAQSFRDARAPAVAPKRGAEKAGKASRGKRAAPAVV